MTKRFTPKVPRGLGHILHNFLTPAQLCDLFLNPKYTYQGQRNHGKNLKNRKHTRGMLVGNAQQFAGAYCEELQSYVNLDGYHRAHAVAEGNAFFPDGYDIELSVFRVRTVAELNKLYEQYNSADAAKKSTCYFESGLRQAGLLNEVGSAWMTGRGKSTAVQMAADLKGTAYTREAVLRVKEGVLFCDKLQLPKTKHVIGGVKGAMIAIAQHAPDKALAATFIKNVCDPVFEPQKPTAADLQVTSYRQMLMTGKFGGFTGASPNTLAFNMALGTFTDIIYRERNRVNPANGPVTLAEFIQRMQDLAPVKKA